MKPRALAAIALVALPVLATACDEYHPNWTVSATWTDGKVTVVGATADRDEPEDALDIAISVDDETLDRQLADGDSDFWTPTYKVCLMSCASYPIEGAGFEHGFSAEITLPPDAKKICVWINGVNHEGHKESSKATKHGLECWMIDDLKAAATTSTTTSTATPTTTGASTTTTTTAAPTTTTSTSTTTMPMPTSTTTIFIPPPPPVDCDLFPMDPMCP